MRLTFKSKAAQEAEEKQRCTECGQRKPLSAFHKFTSRGAEYHRKICICCRRIIETERQRVKRGG